MLKMSETFEEVSKYQARNVLKFQFLLNPIVLGRSFYTTRFGKRSDPDDEQNVDGTEPTVDPPIPEPVQENSPPPRSSFYTTRFGRRSDPTWNAKFLKLHQQQVCFCVCLFKRQPSIANNIQGRLSTTDKMCFGLHLP